MRRAFALLYEVDGGISRTGGELPRELWHTPEGLDDEFDLFAAPATAMRFTTVRALLMGVVRDEGTSSLRVSWRDLGGGDIAVDDIVEVVVNDDETRRTLAREAVQQLLDLVHGMREEFVDPHAWLTYRITR